MIPANKFDAKYATQEASAVDVRILISSDGAITLILSLRNRINWTMRTVASADTVDIAAPDAPSVGMSNELRIIPAMAPQSVEWNTYFSLSIGMNSWTPMTFVKPMNIVAIISICITGMAGMKPLPERIMMR